jgi:hypothetical protein
MQPAGLGSHIHLRAVCWLKKLLYGLKESLESVTFDDNSVSSNRMSRSNNSLYILNNAKSPLLIILYVNDGGEDREDQEATLDKFLIYFSLSLAQS